MRARYGLRTMHRCGSVVVALAAAVAALVPSARAGAPSGCGITSSVVSGAAPLTVSFTAPCASSTYSWDFGDGVFASGPTVQHVFQAGAWTPQVTTDLGA